MKIIKILFIALFILGIFGCSNIQEQPYDEQALVKAYIEENISEISPSEPVLGGTWYTVQIDFLDNQMVEVVYEDGHIQKSFTAKYVIEDENKVIFNDIIEKEE